MVQASFRLLVIRRQTIVYSQTVDNGRRKVPGKDFYKNLKKRDMSTAD